MDALSLPEQMPHARYVVRYAGHNVTADLSNQLLRLTCTDHLTGHSDELELTLEDTDDRWRHDWYPGKGDRLSVSIGWEGAALVDMGHFVIDEVTFQGGPATVAIRALAASIDTAYRTVQNRAYENSTLDAVVAEVAKRHALTLVGAIEPVALDRLTQSDADGAFLVRLAHDYDYAFKVLGEKLVFHAFSELMNAAPVGTLDVGELAPGWSIRDQIKQVPERATVKHHDPATGRLVTYTLTNADTGTSVAPGSVSKAATSADTLNVSGRSVSHEDAVAKAVAGLARSNREQTTGTAQLLGRPLLVSGSVFVLSGAGRLSGRYLITTSRHQLGRSGGYDLEIEFCRVRELSITAKADGADTQKKTTKAQPKLVVYGMDNDKVWGGTNASQQ